MKHRFKNFNQFDKQTNHIYLGILLSLLFAMTLAYYHNQKSFFSLDNSPILLVTGFILTIISLSVMLYIFKSTKKTIKKQHNLSEKLNLYYNSFIIKLIFLWVSGITNSIFYYFTANKLFMVFSAILVLAILMARPYADKLSKEFDASESEKVYFDAPDKNI